jgi:hypothetical protein
MANLVACPAVQEPRIRVALVARVDVLPEAKRFEVVPGPKKSLEHLGFRLSPPDPASPGAACDA